MTLLCTIPIGLIYSRVERGESAGSYEGVGEASEAGGVS